MQHSIIVKFFMAIFKYIKKFYRVSFTRRMINGFTDTVKRFFTNSLIYRIFASENRNTREFLHNSLIGKFEALLQRIMKFFNPVYHAGIKGSSIINNADKVSKRKGSSKVIASMIIGAVIAFNLLSVINKNLNTGQLYISAIIIFISLNLYFIDIRNVYRNSFIRKIVDGLFDI